MKDWREIAKEALLQGVSVQVRPRGSSMQGRIENGDLVTLAPCRVIDLHKNDVALAEIQGKRFTHTVLHLILEAKGTVFLIGNNAGRIDGCVNYDNIYGKVIYVRKSTGTD